MTVVRPYDALLVRGEERKRLILDVAQRLLIRNGWRVRPSRRSPGSRSHICGNPASFRVEGTATARRIGTTGCRRQQARDLGGDIPKNSEHVAERFERSPELIGMFVVRSAGGEPRSRLTPHDRLLHRRQVAVDIVAEGIRRGQREDVPDRPGRGRQGREAVAFINGMETTWLLDRQYPLTRVFRET